MNDKLRLLMIEFEKCLDQYCNVMCNKLEPPFPVSTINQSLGKVNIDDDDLRTYYAWKNGIDYDAVLATNAFDYSSFGVMPTLEFASNVSYENNNSDHMWDSSLFPVIASFGGDFLLYNHNMEDKDYGKIFLYSTSLLCMPSEESYFDSLELMIETHIQCFKNKVFVYDSDQMFLDVDTDAYFEIAAKLNPESKYWKEDLD